MNKLQGFYELDKLEIPSVRWNIYTGQEELDPNLLWTIRVAVVSGNDINLPRAVGVTSEDARKKGNEFLARYKDYGIVIYYPYFIAFKSGILEIKDDSIIIEAVKGDLWNLTTYGYKDVTLIFDLSQENKNTVHGDNFLRKEEIKELLHYGYRVRVKHKDYLARGDSVFLEWSYAADTDIHKRPGGEKYLVFYEFRTVS